jgi:hypothetical protein
MWVGPVTKVPLPRRPRRFCVPLQPLDPSDPSAPGPPSPHHASNDSLCLPCACSRVCAWQVGVAVWEPARMTLSLAQHIEPGR